MPVVLVYSLDHDGGRREKCGELSFQKGDTLLQFRAKVDQCKIFANGYDFWSRNLALRVDREIETFNLVEDYDDITIIQSKHTLATSLGQIGLINVEPECSGTCSPVLPDHNNGDKKVQTEGEDGVSDGVSGKGSNSTSLWPEPSEPFTVPTQPQRGTIGPTEGVSRKMSAELRKLWEDCFERMKCHMRNEGWEDHMCTSHPWDEGEVPRGSILCLECDSFYNWSFSTMFTARMSLRNCFQNFRVGHLTSIKHANNYCRRRKLPVYSSFGTARMWLNFQHQRNLVDQGVAAADLCNANEAGSQPTWKVIGDINRKPCIAASYKVQCSYCKTMISLCPRQKNLDHNLREHVASQHHIDQVKIFEGGKEATPILTSRVVMPPKTDKGDLKPSHIQNGFGNDLGRPAKIDKRDMRPGGNQNVLGSDSGRLIKIDKRDMRPEDNHNVLGSNSGRPGFTLSHLCWGLYQSTILTNEGSRDSKAIETGREWYYEPHTKATVFNNSVGSTVLIQGTFRHRNCSRISRLGGGFEDLTCQSCYSIIFQNGSQV